MRTLVQQIWPTQRLLSDQGRNVDGHLINNLCKNLRIEKRRSSPYHPQGNSTSERAIGTLKSRISAMLKSRNMPTHDWDLLLQEAVLYLNNQINASLKYSPFMLTFGSNARTPIENYYDITPSEPVCPCGRKLFLFDAIMNRHEAAMSYQQQANKAPSINDYQPGERVLVKRTYGEHPKVNVKWLDGPFFIDRKVGPVNWSVTDATGKSRCLHHDMIKKAGSMIEASKTPNSPITDESTHGNCTSKVYIPTLPQAGIQPVIVSNPAVGSSPTEQIASNFNGELSNQNQPDQSNTSIRNNMIDGNTVTSSGRMSVPPDRLGIS